MYIRNAYPEEVAAFYAYLHDTSITGAESDHQDEYVGATALSLPLGVIVSYVTYDDQEHFMHVEGLDVSDALFFIKLRARIPNPDHIAHGSCAPFTQAKCEDIMAYPPDYAFGHEDSDKVVQVWSVQGGVLVDKGGVDTWFCATV